MKQNLQEIFMTKEQQEEILRKRERELTALKGALKEEVSNHDLEIDKLKEQHDKELQNLREALEEATKVSLMVTIHLCEKKLTYARLFGLYTFKSCCDLSTINS